MIHAQNTAQAHIDHLSGVNAIDRGKVGTMKTDRLTPEGVSTIVGILHERLVGALAIARGADLWIRVVADDRRAVRVDGPVMEVGREGDPNAVVTLGCRRHLARNGVHDEAEVLRLVESYGYNYVPPAGQSSASLTSSPRRSANKRRAPSSEAWREAGRQRVRTA